MLLPKPNIAKPWFCTYQRYYSSIMGRFLTPDPYQSDNSGSHGDPSDPQSWNRYSYTRNDPLNRYDPMGLWDCGVNGIPCEAYSQWLTINFGWLFQVRGPAPTDPPQRPLQKGEVAKEDLPGFDKAVDRLTSADCAKALGAPNTMYAENALFKMHYFSDPNGAVIKAPTATGPYYYNVASVNGFTVMLNPNTFFNPSSAPASYADGSTGTKDLVSAFAKQTGLDSTKFTASDFQAAFILHELGHTLGGFQDDTKDSDLSLKYDQKVADNCFKDKK